MIMNISRRLSVALAVALLTVQAGVAFAQDFPNRSVRIIVPTAPGGMSDILCRTFAAKVQERTQRVIVVENKTGANGVLAADYVAKSPPDGYTIYLGFHGTNSVLQHLDARLPYDPAKDFAPVAVIARVPEVLVVNAALPVHSLADLAQLAKSTPGGLSFGSAGAGTAQHLSGVELAAALGVPMTHMPYKGMQPAIGDVAGGHIPFMFSPVSFAVPLAQAGKLRMLGVTTAERIEAVPDVPPLAEIGLKRFDAVSWFMLVAPSGTPPDIVAKLHREVAAVTAAPTGGAARLRALGNRALGRDREVGGARGLAIGVGAGPFCGCRCFGVLDTL
jgi:tripartite-type tricarboxylate transporter receptor subunit TctC